MIDEIVLKEKIDEVLNKYLFEQNTDEIRSKIVKDLYDLVSGNYETYRFVCNSSNNTATTIANNDLILYVINKPMGCMEIYTAKSGQNPNRFEEDDKKLQNMLDMTNNMINILKEPKE